MLLRTPHASAQDEEDDDTGLAVLPLVVESCEYDRLPRCRTYSLWCYTSSMPTTKPRYTITDTGELSEQLNEAQRRWPDVRDRKELLLRLAAAGRDAIEREASRRSDAIRQTAGALTGVYRADELKRLRDDWPA